jgi:two-component system, response regulator YesN
MVKQPCMITPRVLLVDDDQIFRAEFTECFEEYGIQEASNGEEALRILKRPNEIELVLLDVRMSGMNGIEVLTQIRRTSPTIGIVMLTGYSSKDVAVEALRGKADDYIEKPVDIDSTKKLIEKFLWRGKKSQEQGDSNVEDKIEKVKHYLEKNCLRKVSLNDVATVVCLSPKYLSRVFKEKGKIGFNRYKLSLKMAQAKKFLIESRFNIDQISDKLGYQNTESFIRQFKKLTKSTPTEFRGKKGARKKA